MCVCDVPGTRAVIGCSRIRIDSPHIGQSFAGIDISRNDPYRTRSLMAHTFGRFGGGHSAVMTREDQRHDANWFADEVIIDFPSVAPAVDRMRRAFLVDERPRALGASIEISVREALSGATLPLNVPVQCTCSHCGGRGESWTVTCERCGGCGFELLRHAVQVTIPAGVRDGARFRFTVTPRHNRSTRIELRIVVAGPASPDR